MYFSVYGINLFEFTYFRKNANKQLKSADFFNEMSHFQKSLFVKILSFFIMMSKHTMSFIVHSPYVKNLFFLIIQQTLCAPFGDKFFVYSCYLRSNTRPYKMNFKSSIFRISRPFSWQLLKQNINKRQEKP